MSFFKNLFGGGAPKPTITSANEGLEQLEEKADMLRKRLAHIEGQIQEQIKIATTNANTNKAKALQALKKKRDLEERLKTTQGTLDNIENQKDMLENASSNAAVLKTMADTAKIVKQQHNNLNINEVENIVDEIQEQREINDEITKILAGPSTNRVDEDDLLKELEGMQQEQLDAKLLQTDTVPAASAGVSLPDVPAHEVPSATKTDKKAEDELDELKKWAAAAQ